MPDSISDPITELPIYRRVILKLSGEALMGNGQKGGIDPAVLDRIANEVAEIHGLKLQVGVVLGGGNLFRGATLSEVGLGRVTGDQMGMLATVMNALALRDALERMHIPTRILSAIPMLGIVEHYSRRQAIYHLENERVVIFAAGIGNPFFTTDSTASLRGIEVDADVVLKATKVDGVYSADPLKDKNAERFNSLTYDEVIARNLAVMDLTAICICRDHDMPMRVFNINKPGALKRVVLTKEEGTQIQREN